MITNSIIAYGDRLGAQMGTFVSLVYLANENKTDLCFYKELKDFRRGFCIQKSFNLPRYTEEGVRIRFLRRLFLPIPELYCVQFKGKPKSVDNWIRIYKDDKMAKWDRLFHKCITRIFYRDFVIINGKNGIHCDNSLFRLDPKKNYDIRSGFGIYQGWKKYEKDIKKLFVFKRKITKQGDKIYKNIKSEKQTVSIHFRKGDYLILSSLNLTNDYYRQALSYFNKNDYKLIVFSDDIDSCINTGLFDEYEVYYMKPHDPGVDMYLMSLCDNNIIANSSFSFWGAFLNKNENKKVVCPHDYIGSSDQANLYINGNWYPDEWIAL